MIQQYCSVLLHIPQEEQCCSILLITMNSVAPQHGCILFLTTWDNFHMSHDLGAVTIFRFSELGLGLGLG